MKLLTLFTEKFVFMFLKNPVLTSLEHTQRAVEFCCPVRWHNNMFQSFVFNFIPISSILNSVRICISRDKLCFCDSPRYMQVLRKSKRCVDSDLVSGYFRKKVRKKLTYTIFAVHFSTTTFDLEQLGAYDRFFFRSPR